VCFALEGRPLLLFSRYSMRHRISLVLTLAAWLLATGSQWDLAQTFAWSRMFATYSRTMCVTEAVQKTFDGEMCPICAAVQEARQQQDTGGVPEDGSRLSGKIVFVSAPGALVFAAATRCVGLAPAAALPLSADRSAPPSPPPRAPA
jgi:hypothetical protein